jgi:RNA polymerase sigma-70 factor (ECF subfamily)
MRAALAVSDDLDHALALARDGNPAAFAAIVRRHQAMVFSLAFHTLRSRPAAEDLTQDVFVELYRCLGRMQSAAHVEAWLRRVTSHRCIDELRRPRHRLELATGTLPDRGQPPASPEPFLEERLRILMAELPPHARIVVVLRYQEELEPSEIADVLNMSVNTVKSHLRRSIATLRKALARLKPTPTTDKVTS